MKKCKKMNWGIVLSNVNEAKKQLEDLAKEIKKNGNLSESEFSIALKHACHHINFAWNCRYASDNEYANMTDKDFRKWSKSPSLLNRVFKKHL